MQWPLAYLVPLPRELLCVMLESPHAYLIGVHSAWLPDVDKLLHEKMGLGEQVVGPCLPACRLVLLLTLFVVGWLGGWWRVVL